MARFYGKTEDLKHLRLMNRDILEKGCMKAFDAGKLLDVYKRQGGRQRSDYASNHGVNVGIPPLQHWISNLGSHHKLSWP